MAKYIYTRVSTDGQSGDPQVQQLSDLYPDARVINEVASGMKKRPMLHALVAQLQPGDWLIVAALDRLGRRTSEVLFLIEQLEERRVILKSVREGVDYATPAGRLVTQILISVAEMERAMISARTKAGLEAARKSGKKIGRPPFVTPEQRQLAIDLVMQGETHKKAAKKAGISRPYVTRLIGRIEGESNE